MGKMSTEKGKRGERQVVTMANSFGLHARRTAPLQAGAPGAADVLIDEAPKCHIEVKRAERLSIDAMVKQATEDALQTGVAKDPVVLWKRNRGLWRADIPMHLFFDLLRGYHRA